MKKKIIVSVTLLASINNHSMETKPKDAEKSSCFEAVAAFFNIKERCNKNLEQAADDPDVPQEWRDAFKEIAREKNRGSAHATKKKGSYGTFKKK